jgi:hypothetical protein
VIFGTYRDLLAAIAGTSGALTGLLFVALSVAPRRTLLSGPPVIRQIRAAAALLAFTNALAVSLYGLIPEINVGYPAAVLGVIGVTFTAAAVRSILDSETTSRERLHQLSLVVLLLAIFGTELVGGITLVFGPANTTSIQLISYALVTSLVVGIARAWELVGERDTGITASIAALKGHPLRQDDDRDDNGGTGPAEQTGGGTGG